MNYLQGNLFVMKNKKNIADKNLLSLLEHRLYDDSNSEEIGFAKFQFIGEQIEQIGIWRRCLIENEENRLRGFCLREV